MDPTVSAIQYEEKINQLLQKLLDANFIVTSDTYLNSLLSHLSGKDDKDLGAALLNLPVFVQWLIKATQYWEDTGTIPSQSIISFIINLTSLLSKNEDRFNRLNVCNVYLRLCAVLKIRTSTTSATVKVSYIKLLLSFLEHKSGINWLIATNNWQDVLGYCLEGPSTTYVLREGHNFLYNLLIEASNYNLVFCNMVIEKLMSVFNELNFINGIVNDESLQKKLTPTLRILSHIFVSSLQNKLGSKDYRIPKIFIKDYNLEQTVWNIIMITSHNEEFFMDLNKIMALTNFFDLAFDLKTERFQCNRLKKMVAEIYKLIGMNISKGFVLNVCHLCHLLQYYWKLMEFQLPNVDFGSEEVQILFESQILVFQVLPFPMISYKECSVQSSHLCEDEFRDHFMAKVFKTLCEHTVRLGYNYRSLLISEKVNLFDAALQATAYIMKTRQYYHRDTAVIVFQYSMYTLNDIILATKAKPEMRDVFTKYTSYFVAMFDVISTFIKEFDITWRESVETISVMNVAVDYVSVTCWAPKMIVQAFKLINLSIARFMSPNLALLVEGSNEFTAMTKLGGLLQTKLHDREWEVRDSALEVIHTISEIALTKYPAFQNAIIDFEFPSLMVTMGMHDSESYVRAMAIKCLQEMIKVPRFWNSLLDQEDLPMKMIKILYTETEANVRCEAATLLSQLYEHRSFTKLLKEQINQAMVYAATSDLDWEVRESALSYWKKVIDYHLTNQGMIDGTFPTFTFSKEKRKIVNLTDKEIRNRLNMVLEELSKCGCLGVLVTAMQDNCDIKVLKKAVEITKTLSNFLKLYNIIRDTSTEASLSPTPIMSAINVVNNSATINEYSDAVVNDIVNCQDIRLLVNVMAKEQDIYSFSGLVPKQNIVSAKDFLSFIQRDLDKMVTERTTWLNQIDDLGSLLDDILKCYDNDINAMDCY
ncbi:hypothetical protein RN001_013846 [Aquatica leii]|uniref:BRCA1-associated ATM activator 1 n=1 Tax=Aquatica leii TaxID=1421715 RepID=A0AAN7S787_9COLE|nr:hypothetical protein RN001_013846 [Aquatica leii]